jgi:hypothetical protein
MAQIVPLGWREPTAVGSPQREIETLSRLAEHPPDDYTLQHGEFGRPILGEGELRAKSVYRSKGQTGRRGADRDQFREFDAVSWRKPFVGMPRARLDLVLAVNERSASVLLKQMA